MMKLQEYKKLITRDFTRNTRRGFADWRDCGNLCMDVIEALESARKDLCAENRYVDLFSLSNWTLVKWSHTDKDDSNGETQEFCSEIFEIWETVYQDGEAYVSHDVMMDTLFMFQDGRFYDYIEDIIYDFILKYFKTEKELARKEQFLLKVMEDLKRRIPENDLLRYSLYVIEHYYARVLADQRRPIQKIRDFLNARDDYTNHDLLAQIEMEYGNYDEAVALYKGQIDKRRDPYWADAPRKALMEIYKIQGKIDAYNNELFNMMRAHTESDRYYLEYKALFTEEEWQIKWEKLLEDYKDRLSAINKWLSIEDRYDLIMDNAEPDNEYVIDSYGDKLFQLYPKRCLKVLTNVSDRQAQSSKNRRDYRRIVKILNKISVYPGGKELAAELAAKYRAQYPRRSAMLDELKIF